MQMTECSEISHILHFFKHFQSLCSHSHFQKETLKSHIFVYIKGCIHLSNRIKILYQTNEIKYFPTFLPLYILIENPLKL